MKRNKIILAGMGLIITVLLYALIAGKLGYWTSTRWFFIVLSAAYFAYSGFERHIPLSRWCMWSIVAITGVASLSSIVAGLDGITVIWSFVSGLVVSIVSTMAVYYCTRNFLPGTSNTRGLPIIIEIALVFFSVPLCIMLIMFDMRFTTFMLFTPIMVVIALLIGWIIRSTLVKEGHGLAREISNWHSDNTIGASANDVFKTIVHAASIVLEGTKESFNALQKMGNEIKTSSEDLSSVSEQMNASLQEVSSTIQQISKGAQEQSSSITSIARSVEQLNNLTTSISSQVKMASVSSRRTTTSAQDGRKLSKQEASISKEIYEQTQFINDKTMRLRDQAIEIKKILDIIAGITEQTDLLALNAAIEAARVGEQGKGFAVVADEIRNLATETQHSSSIVESLILEINNSIQELSALLTAEREKMTESKELAIRTEEQFTGISKAVDLVTDMISRINEAAANQASNTKELVKQVEQIAQVAAETAASTEEVSASVQEQTASMQEFTSTAQVLAQFAMKLEELLIKFK